MSEDYFLLPPQEQIFYQRFASTMNIMCLGKQTWWGYKPAHWFIRFHGEIVPRVAPFITFTQFLYLYLNFNDLTFDVIGIMCSIIPVSILVNINVFSSGLKVYKKVMQNFMTQIHIRNYCKDQNEYMKKKLLLVERVTRFTAYYLIFFFGLNWFFWITIPMLHNVTNKEQILNKTMQLQTCIYVWMPFDYGYAFRNWIVIHVLNVYLVGCGVIIMVVLHCLNYIFIYHLISHIQILKNTMKTDFVGDVCDEEVKRRLIGLIKHHAFIISVFEDVQSAFGVNVAANYLHNLFSDSFILYQVLNGGDVLSYAVMVGAYMGELVLMSFVIEEIRKQSEDLPEVVYGIPWESMTVSNQKIFILLLMRMQAQMQFKALGGLIAGVQPMVSILKTTFSYYVMLKTSIET